MIRHAMVLTRQLPPENIPVVTAVVVAKDDAEYDNVKQYLESECDDKIKEFTDMFVEFKGATWTQSFVELDIP